MPNAYDVRSQLIANCPRQSIGRQRKVTERPVSAALKPVIAKIVAPVLTKIVAPVLTKVVAPVIAKVIVPVIATVVAPVIAKVVGPATAARAIEVGKSWAFTEHRSLAAIWALADPSVEGFVMSEFALEIVRIANVIIGQRDNSKLDDLPKS